MVIGWSLGKRAGFRGRCRTSACRRRGEPAGRRSRERPRDPGDRNDRPDTTRTVSDRGASALYRRDFVRGQFLYRLYRRLSAPERGQKQRLSRAGRGGAKAKATEAGRRVAEAKAAEKARRVKPKAAEDAPRVVKSKAGGAPGKRPEETATSPADRTASQKPTAPRMRENDPLRKSSRARRRPSQEHQGIARALS
jgi:hypothetical protein